MNKDNNDKVKDSLFYNYSRYLKEKYNVPAFRVGIDAGFSCPNRKDGRNSQGCSYCDAFGARAMYQRSDVLFSDASNKGLFKDIKQQTEKAVAFLEKRYKAKIFLLYLQAFSNTYGTIEQIKNIYNYALSLKDYSELIISTRPDCIDEEKADLLLEYQNKGYDVWVELGLQSSNDDTLKKINRGHNVADFEKAIKILKDRKIKNAIHLIFGLPDEDEKQIIETCKYTASIKPDGVKFHNLHVPYNTPLYQDYLDGKIKVPTAKEHLEYVISAIELMPKSTIIMRITCDSSESERAAPKSFMKKTEFYNLLWKEMNKRKTFQGRLYNENTFK